MFCRDDWDLAYTLQRTCIWVQKRPDQTAPTLRYLCMRLHSLLFYGCVEQAEEKHARLRFAYTFRARLC